MMRLKHTLAAGVAALALLVTPVELTAHWSDHGPSISTAAAVEMAHAASNRPTSTKPPTNGAPTITSSGGNASRTQGFQTGQGRFTDEQCQMLADAIDRGAIASWNDKADHPASDGTRDFDSENAQDLASYGMDGGCAFID